MSNILMVIAQDMFRDEELFETKEELEKADHNVKVASRELKFCNGNQGGEIMPDLTLDSADINEYDALIFVGGGGAKEYYEDKTVHEMAKKIDSAGKILAAICIAPVILAKAGLLFGKNATVFPTGAPDIIQKGANYTEDSVTVDGNIITANGPKSSREFGKKIAEKLAEKATDIK